MKKVLFLILAVGFLNGCTGSSGGTTTEAPIPVPTPTPIPPPVGEFNIIQSSFQILNQSGLEITSAGVGESLKLRLIAKNQYGNLMSGLSIRFGRINTTEPDLIPTEISAGVYEASISFLDQIQEEFYVKKDNSSVNLNKNIFVSFCSGNSSPSASPFHNTAVLSGNTYYIICNANQLSQAGNFLSRNFILGNNINLSSFYVDSNSDQIPDNQFKIGNDITGYSGKFRGYGLSISNFSYINASMMNVGFFGKISEGAEISGLVLDSPKVVGLMNVGSFAGSIESLTLPISLNSITVMNGQNDSKTGDYHGGVIGQVSGSSNNISITNCSFSGLINLNNSLTPRQSIGGIFGKVSQSILSQNSFDGFITFDDKTVAVSAVGGLSGEFKDITNYSSNSVNVSLLINSGSDVGGLVGIVSSSNLSTSYTNTISLNVTGTLNSNFSRLGGMFGSVNDSSISSITSFINVIGVLKDSFGGVAHTLFNVNSSQIILNGSFNFDSNEVGGMYSFVEDSVIGKNWNYSYIQSLTSNSSIGGIASTMLNSIMSSSTFEGTIDATLSSNIGGLISIADGTVTVSNSSFKGTLKGNTNVAGLIYTMTGTDPIIIGESFSSGDIFANNFASGMIFDLLTNSQIQDSFVTSKIRTYSDGLVPSSFSITNNRENNTSLINNVFFLSSLTGANACGVTTCATATNTNTNSPTDINYYFNVANAPLNSWNFTSVWQTFGSYPLLRY